MRTQTTRTLLTATLALVLGACTTNNQRSDVVASAVLLSTITVTPAAAGTEFMYSCACPSATGSETDFHVFNLNFGACIALLNQLPNNGDGKIRLNSNDFVVEDFRLNYEATDGTPLAIPETVTPANATVLAGGSLAVPSLLIPTSVATMVPAGKTVRVHLIAEGRLLDGSKVKSSEYEYIATKCSGTGCVTPAIVGLCSVTKATACARDSDCPATETCAITVHGDVCND